MLALLRHSGRSSAGVSMVHRGFWVGLQQGLRVGLQVLLCVPSACAGSPACSSSPGLQQGLRVGLQVLVWVPAGAVSGALQQGLRVGLQVLFWVACNSGGVDSS